MGYWKKSGSITEENKAHTHLFHSQECELRFMCLIVFVHSVPYESSTPWITAHQASLSFTISWSLLKLMSIKSVILCLIFCHPLLLSSIIPSIRVFSKSWLFASGDQSTAASASISPSNEYSGLISFRIDRFDLLVIQGTLKSLLQHHSSKPSILWCSAFFKVQLSQPCMTTGKTTAGTHLCCPLLTSSWTL